MIQDANLQDGRCGKKGKDDARNVTVLSNINENCFDIWRYNQRCPYCPELI